MRIFHCDRCGGTVPFAAHSCETCGAAIGYVPDHRALRAIVPSYDPTVFRFDVSVFRINRPGTDSTAMWRCLNSAWGCNWMLPADSGQTWCRSCRLTRGRPDVDRPGAIEAWMTAEAAKRRLVHQLDEFALPIEIESESMPDGLVFDLVYLPGQGGLTGHVDGVVTIDLAETDEGHRNDQRRRLGEPIRTVIGHLRHEVGHYYWPRLVGQTNEIGAFRRLFGDEREDYGEAVESYDAGTGDCWDRTRFLTSYAAAHPLEDWAETFAHYLHIVDSIDTAVAHHLIPSDSAGGLVTNAIGRLAFTDILDAWRPVNAALNAIAETVGAPAVYPIEPAGAAIDKLAFAHHQIAAHTARDQFYADH